MLFVRYGYHISGFQIFYSYALFRKIITLTVLHKLHQLKEEKRNTTKHGESKLKCAQ